MSQRVTITENGRKLKVSKQRALIKKWFLLAAAGNPKALDVIHRLIEKYGSEQKPITAGSIPLSPEDQAIMDELLGKSSHRSSIDKGDKND